VPKVVGLFGLPSGAGIGAGDDGSIRLHAGQGESDVIVRQYRQGDDLRKVHWRSTARRDEIMVRVEERPWRGGTTVLLDHRAAAHHGAGRHSRMCRQRGEKQQANLKKNYSGYWISDLFEVAKNNGTSYYVTLENGDKKVVLTSANGSDWSTYKKDRKI